MKHQHCQACGWIGETDHACPQCGGQDWSPAPSPPPASKPEPKQPVSPSRTSRR